LILKTARNYMIDMKNLLASSTECIVSRKNRHSGWVEKVSKDCAGTVLHSLIFNPKATIESFRLICNEWPRVIYIRGEDWYDHLKTMLMHLTFSCSDDGNIERLEALNV